MDFRNIGSNFAHIKMLLFNLRKTFMKKFFYPALLTAIITFSGCNKDHTK